MITALLTLEYGMDGTSLLFRHLYSCLSNVVSKLVSKLYQNDV